MKQKIKIYSFFKYILTFTYAFLIFYVSSQDTSSVTLPVFSDKIIHFFEFGLLCFMICWSVFSFSIRIKHIYIVIIAICITSLYGLSDEIHQYFTPHRSVDVLDWFADTSGAVTAGFFWKMLVYKLQRKQKSLAMGKTPINM
ncbi:MAG: hypothetical protein A3J73_02980 [Planctomycetes bacterium RIFCSPHIGHO2_02_FULL_38_41]|nr:MAG: hypothetical protein A3J73_02980 [Planctomycetes bacterium RIFCSPHIGHO2_02_FULL_38_41]